MKTKLFILFILFILPIFCYARGLYVNDLVTSTGAEIVLGNDTKENELLSFASYYGFNQLNFLTLDSCIEEWVYPNEDLGLLNILLNESRTIDREMLKKFLNKARNEYGIETFAITLSYYLVVTFPDLYDYDFLDLIADFVDDDGIPYFSKLLLEQDIDSDYPFEYYMATLNGLIEHNSYFTICAYLGNIPSTLEQDYVINTILNSGLDEIYPSFYSTTPSDVGYTDQLEKLKIIIDNFDNSKIFPIFSAESTSSSFGMDTSNNFMGDYFNNSQSAEINCFELAESEFKELINSEEGYEDVNFEWFNVFATEFLFCIPNLTEIKEINTNKFSWLSFPRYNNTNNDIANIMVDLTLNTSLDSARVISMNNEIAEYINGNWTSSFNITPETFYKLKASSEDEKLFFWVGGNLAYDQEIEIPLYEYSFTTKWIGYWKKEPQTLKEAFLNDNGEYNETWEFIESVSSEDSYYSKNHTIRGIDEHQTYSSNPENIILEYGKGYKVTFLPTSYTNHQDITSIDFEWGLETNTFDYRKKKATTYFTYNVKPEYIAVDIVEFDDIGEVKEIGVFADGKCIGATVVDSLPLQVLIYPDVVNKANQGFELRTVNNNRSEVTLQYKVYDDEINSFTSKPLTSGKEIYYVKVKKNNDHSINGSSSITAMNYPNPFNPSTTISFSINEDSNVKVEIYNIIGQKIKILKDGYLTKGKYSYIWDGKNNSDKEVSSGVYFYKISTKHNTKQEKILLIK